MKICFHHWYKWSELIESYNGHKTQFRDCAKCGKTKFRDLGYCDGVPTYLANEALRVVRSGEVKP